MFSWKELSESKKNISVRCRVLDGAKPELHTEDTFPLFGTLFVVKVSEESSHINSGEQEIL